MTRGASTTSLDPLATAPSGYLNIEDYLHFMAEPHAITARNRPFAMDLKPLVAGFANQAFTVSNATNGTVSLAADGHSAQFFPASNFVGIGSFQFSLPYPDGAIATFTVNVCVTTVAL